jgi:hypothetical protein
MHACTRARPCARGRAAPSPQIDYLASIGLQQDQICNMASISVVLLGLNPETRLATVVDYLKKRGLPADQVPDVVLKHPRIFEYKVGAVGPSFLIR